MYQGHPKGARARAAPLARPAPPPNKTFARSPRDVQAGRTTAAPHPSAQPRSTQNWPLQIAFLAQEGLAPEILTAAAAIAKTQGVSAEAALLATGLISETRYYRALARHLGVYFIDGTVAIAPLAQYPQAIHAGVAPLDHPDHSAFIVAPRGASIATLIKSVPYGELRDRLAITAPTHLSSLMRSHFRKRILHDASFALLNLDPALSARGRVQRLFPLGFAAGVLMALCAALTVLGPGSFLATLMSFAFLAIIFLRILVCAAAIEAIPLIGRRISDDQLPLYSIVVALYREARVVPQLVAALEQISYPAAKLDIKFVIEEDDDETFKALRKSVRQFAHEIIVAPNGTPRTKPRALNVALPLLRGEFVAIYDAEDLPDVLQLREAAERFANAPPTLACLQARLAIDNLQSWLPQLFAIEYAALFDVINVGLADMGLPFALGGSSNHFRTAVLRKIGGWDAWNVTEDADIGFRMARFGYDCATFDSTTYEEAPTRISAFLGQRRRWCKGWYQTLFTLCRNPRRLLREVGVLRGTAMIVILLSSVLAPLGGPLVLALLGWLLAQGGPTWPSNGFEATAATLWTTVFFGGGAAIFGPILLGMKRRGLLSLWPSLMLLPIYFGLISIAAWTSLYDLMVRPYHWYKTEHGVANAHRRRSRPRGA